MAGGFVTEADFRQRVRRHRPTALLPLIAQASILYPTPKEWLISPGRRVLPWALADIARVSLVAGNEFRGDADPTDVLDLLNKYAELAEPYILPADLADPDPLYGFLLRVFGEQLGWQASPYRELARTAALFLDTPWPSKAQVPEDWAKETFGCTLPQYLAVALMLYALTCAHNGWYDPDLLARPGAGLVTDVVPREVIDRVVRLHFTADQAQFRALEAKGKDPIVPAMLRRFTFNPLRARPLISGFQRAHLAPVQRLVLAKAMPLGVYYSGVDRFGNPFAQAFGDTLEPYVGRQLKLLSGATVHPEITYKVGRDVRHSVDWFVVFEDLVLLVEVKSRRPGEALRLGTGEHDSQLARDLGKAFNQLLTSRDLIVTGAPEFAHLPSDRPFVGMIVTAEPYALANATNLDIGLPTTDLTTLVASIADVEGLVTVNDTAPSTLLLAVAGDPERSTWALHENLAGHSLTRNAVLDEAWQRHVPWQDPELLGSP